MVEKKSYLAGVEERFQQFNDNPVDFSLKSGAAGFLGTKIAENAPAALEQINEHPAGSLGGVVGQIVDPIPKKEAKTR